MRDVFLFLGRINARLSQRLRFEASIHGIKLDGVEGAEESTTPQAPLTDDQKRAMECQLAEAQSRVKARWAQTN